jgi:hypothetical protein
VKTAGLAALAAVLALAAGPGGAQDEPEAVYLKLHRATLVHNLDEMLLYTSEARRAELAGTAGSSVMLKLISSMMPRVYTVRSTALTPDGLRAQMRATGTFTFMGSTAPSYGTIEFVKQKGEWKVERFEWSGDKPAGFDTVRAPYERMRRAPASAQAPQPAPVPAPEQKPAPAPLPAASAEAKAEPRPAPEPAEKPAAAPPMIERSTSQPCVIKPVMSDEDLRNCGAQVPMR